MRKPLSLAGKVIRNSRMVDLQHTDVRATFARVRAEQRQAKAKQAQDEAQTATKVRSIGGKKT